MSIYQSETGKLNDTFARLLANENIQIIYDPRISTAMFDPKNRTLRLPVWSHVSYDVKRMLIGHEVAHALFTPVDDKDKRGGERVKWTKKLSERGKVYMSFLNVVEDARIEKLIKRRYPGLKSSFYGGYNELVEKDFFGLKGKKIPEMHLVDRLNLYAKAKHFIDVEFRKDERSFVTDLENLETFGDTVRLADRLWDYVEEQQKQQQMEMAACDNPQENDKEKDKKDSKSGKSKNPDKNEKEDNDDSSDDRDKQESKSNDQDKQESKSKDDQDGKSGNKKKKQDKPDQKESKSGKGEDEEDESSDSKDEDSGSDADKNEDEGSSSEPEDEEENETDSESDEGDEDDSESDEDKEGDNDSQENGGDKESDGKPQEGDGSGSVGPAPLQTNKSFDKDLSGNEDAGDVGLEKVKPGSEEKGSPAKTDENGIPLNTLDQELVGGYGSPINHSVFLPIRTNDSLAEMLEKHTSKASGSLVYGSIPDDLSKASSFIVPHKEIYQNIKNTADATIQSYEKEWATFRKENKNTIAFMAMEFEMRKKARLTKRAQVSKTGMIDMSRIHTYQLQEDIFKRVTVLPKGKSHGVVFFIDWSGSMSGYIEKTIKQMLNLVMFCKRIKIPFEVYAFSDSVSSARTPDEIKAKGDNISINYGYYRDAVRLLNLMSSKMTAQEFEYAAKYLLAFGKANSGGYGRRDVGPYHLGGTPLNSSIMLSMDIVPRLKEEFRVDVMNVFWLTDGASNGISTADGAHPNVIRDKRTGITFSVPYAHGTQPGVNGDPTAVTGQLLRVAKERTGANLVGFFLTSAGYVTEQQKFAIGYGLNPKMFRQAGVMTVEGYKGYDLYISIDQEKMYLDTEISLNLAKKKESRIMLSQLIELIS